MQSKAKPFDDITNLVTNAVGAMKGVGDEVKAMGRARAEEMIADLDLVGRDEFAILKEIVQAQSLEIAALKKQINAGGAKPAAKKTTTKKTTTRKPAAKKAPVKKAAAKKTAAKKAAPKKTASKKTSAKKKT